MCFKGFHFQKIPFRIGCGYHGCATYTHTHSRWVSLATNIQEKEMENAKIHHNATGLLPWKKWICVSRSLQSLYGGALHALGRSQTWDLVLVHTVYFYWLLCAILGKVKLTAETFGIVLQCLHLILASERVTQTYSDQRKHSTIEGISGLSGYYSTRV